MRLWMQTLQIDIPPKGSFESFELAGQNCEPKPGNFSKYNAHVLTIFIKMSGISGKIIFCPNVSLMKKKDRNYCKLVEKRF